MIARRRHRLLLAALLLALGWLAGFGWFLHVVLTPAPPPPRADGIVVFTGGADRVETALRLLAAGRGGKLLVSGVGHDAGFIELARRAHVDVSLAPLVTLGRAAISTRGNAIETAAWVHANGLHTLIVVTAAYHMPRALVELSRTLPDVALYPVPVLPPAMREGLEIPELRLLAGEYMKWLAAEIGLSALAPHDGEMLPGAEPERHHMEQSDE
jgi:uncharacterized SAM-binding protein YcdF (DUF218 family)